MSLLQIQTTVAKLVNSEEIALRSVINSFVHKANKRQEITLDRKVNYFAVYIDTWKN
jgi:hypothetical protein